MALVNVTAILMGDPAARWTRRPSPAEVERTRFVELNPVAKLGQGRRRAASALGEAVRAMQVGDVVEMPSGTVGNNFQCQMARVYGWMMSCRTVKLADGTRRCELKRVR